METKKSTLRRLASTGGVLALVLAGAIGGAGMASATEVPVDGTAPGNAPAGSVGTLVVHKHVGTTTTNPNNGTQQTVDRLPLAGAGFTVCKVGELSTSADWEAVAALEVDDYTCTQATAGSATMTTIADGSATFEHLPIGLYKVVETTVPAGATGSLDFLVALPFPSKDTTVTPATSNWLWTVHTYPKNTITPTSSKTVADPGTHGLGSLVPWTIKSNPLGSLNNGQALTAYALVDDLNDHLRYEETTSLVSVAPGGVETPVPSGMATIPTASAAAGGTVTVTFDPAYVNSLPTGTYFRWQLTTEVTGIGALENKAFENPGTGNQEVGSATTVWGAMRLLKVDATAQTTGLAGAEFQVFDVNGQGTCVGDLGAAISVDDGTTTASTFVSDANGVVEVAGLYVGQAGANSHDYCVKETKAPAGYTAATAAFLVTVHPGAVAQGEYSADAVLNTPVNGPMLPLTGSNGTLWFTVGGIALIVIAAGGLLMMRRSRSHG
ncbi:SpaH/EbpB family LPXTG-anchored major pilin [Microbacterium sp. NPDC058342]|uniref:SpaH/EbpB family LPXTG-anchored major pilin n=1 Tax=Microbacterium sp. NPDC058342 TaxID=3346454 RepID=UPI00364D4ECF